MPHIAWRWDLEPELSEALLASLLLGSRFVFNNMGGQKASVFI